MKREARAKPHIGKQASLCGVNTNDNVDAWVLPVALKASVAYQSDSVQRHDIDILPHSVLDCRSIEPAMRLSPLK